MPPGTAGGQVGPKLQPLIDEAARRGEVIGFYSKTGTPKIPDANNTPEALAVRQLSEGFTELGVGTDDIARTDEARTALAFVAHDDKGDRSFSFYRPPAADLLFRPEHFRKEAFDKLAIFHVCSNSLTEAAIAATTVEGMRRARAAGALVSFDMNLRPALWPKDEAALPRLWETLHEADVIKLSAEEFAFIHAGAGSDDAVLERLWKGKARLLLVTDGAEPMRWFSRDVMPAFSGR